MRRLQRNLLARAFAAMVASALLSWVAWRAGLAVIAALLFALLSVVFFVALTAAPDFIAYWRRHEWRWWWRASNDEGPFWPGTCVPRHPRW